MSPDDRIRLQHMVDAIETVSGFLSGRGREDLDADQMLVFALVRAVEVMGEAASKLSPAGRDELSTIPWSSIIGMRNRLIHAYFDVDLNILWNTVTQSLPPLRTELQKALGDHGYEES